MKNTKRAFTLVEMLIVIVIIGILAAALIPQLTGIQGKARDTARQTAVSQINAAVKSYSIDNQGDYPASLTGVTSTDYMNKVPENGGFSDTATATDCRDNKVAKGGGFLYVQTDAKDAYAISAGLEAAKGGNAEDCRAASTEKGQGGVFKLYNK